MSKTDEIMNLAYTLADAKVEHAIAAREFANNQGDLEYDDIKRLADAWTKAENVLRAAVKRLED